MRCQMPNDTVGALGIKGVNKVTRPKKEPSLLPRDIG
jgi:hypothetical protein